MSITNLVDLVPPPPQPRELGAANEWSKVEAQLGTSLPADYKDLIATYGTGQFNEYLTVFNPFAANEHRNLLALKEKILSAYRTSQNMFPDEYPLPTFPTAGGLLPWARSDNGDTFYWITGEEPDTWPVYVIKTNSAQYRYDLNSITFLLQLLSNSLSPALYDEDWYEDIGHPYFLADVQRS